MGIHPGQIERDSPLLIQPVTLLLDAPGNSIDKIVDKFKPGFAFQVQKVEIYPTALSSQAIVDVQIGGTSVLASTVTDPAVETLAEPSLASVVADLRGDETETLDVNVNTDAGGDITGSVRVDIRPWPAGGDPQ